MNIVAEGMLSSSTSIIDQFNNVLFGTPQYFRYAGSFDLKIETELHFKNKWFVGFKTDRRLSHIELLPQNLGNYAVDGRVYHLYSGLTTASNFWQLYFGVGFFDQQNYTRHNENSNANINIDKIETENSLRVSLGSKFFHKNAFLKTGFEFGLNNYSFSNKLHLNSNFQIGLGYNFIKIKKNKIEKLRSRSKRIHSLNRFTLTFDIGYSFNNLKIPFSDWSAVELPFLDGLRLENRIYGEQTEIPSNVQFRNYEANFANSPEVGLTLIGRINQHLKFSYSFGFKQIALQHSGEFQYNSYVFNDSSELGYYFQSDWKRFSTTGNNNLGLYSKTQFFRHNISCHIGKQLRKIQVDLFFGTSLRFAFFDELPGLDLYSTSSLNQGFSFGLRNYSLKVSHEVLVSRKIRQYGYSWHSINFGVSYTFAKWFNFKNIVFE